MSEILKTQSASCLGAHERFLALGTKEGNLYILDFGGNAVKRFSVHTKAINAISIDAVRCVVCGCMCSVPGVPYMLHGMNIVYWMPGG